MKRIFVTGTDTGVGKTVLSLLLMQFFYQRGLSPFYLKPLQTGCADAYDRESDATFIYRHVTELRGKDPAESVVYCFRNPKAPFFAARDDGREIDLEVIDQVIGERSRLHSPLVLEAAGGLLVPVKDETLMIDVIKGSRAGVIMAARAGLGTINHTLLSLEALEARGLKPAGVIFLDPAETPPDVIAENRSAVARYSGIKVTGVIGRIENFSSPPHDCYRPLEVLFPPLP